MSSKSDFWSSRL